MQGEFLCNGGLVLGILIKLLVKHIQQLNETLYQQNSLRDNNKSRNILIQEHRALLIQDEDKRRWVGADKGFFEEGYQGTHIRWEACHMLFWKTLRNLNYELTMI